MTPLSNEALEQVFTKARSHNGWLDKKVSEDTLHAIYDLAKMGPTAVNSLPMRILFVQTPEGKETLLSAMAAGNVEKTRQAPVVAVIAYDSEFFEHLKTTFPHADAKSWYLGNQALIDETAMRNGTLQGAYFMLAARALGLDCGPMSGFDVSKVNDLFFKGTTWKANFVCNLGYGDEAKLHPRLPRLSFEQACKIV